MWWPLFRKAGSSLPTDIASVCLSDSSKTLGRGHHVGTNMPVDLLLCGGVDEKVGGEKEMEFSSKGVKGTVLIRVLFIVIKIRDQEK